MRSSVRRFTPFTVASPSATRQSLKSCRHVLKAQVKDDSGNIIASIEEDLLDASLEEEFELERDEADAASEAAVDAEDVMGAIAEEAVYEAEFVRTSGGRSDNQYLQALEADMLETLVEGGSLPASALAAFGDYAAAAVADSEEVAVEEVEGAVSGEQADVLSHLSNEEYAAANEAVASLKLSREELGKLVPEEWDTETIDWFSNKKAEQIPLPEFKLNFLWLRTNIAVGVDQVYARGQKSPLTEFFVWPLKDAWEELKVALESRPWVTERDRVILLNRLTEVINFWQEPGDEKPTIDDARNRFPDCSFSGV